MNNRTFGFRANLTDSRFDTAISLVSQNGERITNREFTIRTFLIMLGGIICLMIIETQTVIIKSAISAIGFGILWCWLIWEISQPLPTKKIAASYIPVLIRYMYKANRYFSFRSFAPAYSVSKLTGIQENGISDTGEIRFLNNDVGRVFEITGSASRLMFDADRERVVNDARNFYRNINPTTTLIIDTLSSPQRVTMQLKAKKWQYDNLLINDDNLKRLLLSERDMLEENVGHDYPMYHQYFVVRAVNQDELHMFIEWIMQCLGSASLFLKDIRPMDSKQEVINYLHQLYSADSEILNGTSEN